jgi:hypothetical protein
MSYVLTPFMIDLSKLRAAVGSKDAALVRAIRASKPEKFEKVDQQGDLSLGDALSRLVMGDKLGQDQAHQYGYALEALCHHLGEVIWPDVWGGVRWAAMEDTGVDAVMESGPPVPLPPINDFPTIGFLEAAEIRRRVEEMGDEGLTNDDEDLQELLEEFEGWLRTAASKGKDLVFFYR